MVRPKQWTLDALDPDDPTGIRKVCWISQETISFITRGVLKARWFRILCVRDVLATPVAVFRGWNREGFEDALCYVGRPNDRPAQGIELPPPPDRHFLVFVLPSGKIEEWRWERFNPDNDQDCRTQFGDAWSRIWPPTQAI